MVGHFADGVPMVKVPVFYALTKFNVHFTTDQYSFDAARLYFDKTQKNIRDDYYWMVYYNVRIR